MLDSLSPAPKFADVKDKLRANAFSLSSLFFMLPSMYEVIECYKAAIENNHSPVAAGALMLGAGLFFAEEVVGMAPIFHRKISEDSVKRIGSALGQIASASYALAGIAMKDPSLIMSGIIFGIAIRCQMHKDKSGLVVPRIPQGASLGRRIAIHTQCILQNIQNRSMSKSAALEVVGVGASASALYTILPAPVATTIIGLEFLGVGFLAMADGIGHSPQKSADVISGEPANIRRRRARPNMPLPVAATQGAANPLKFATSCWYNSRLNSTIKSGASEKFFHSVRWNSGAWCPSS